MSEHIELPIIYREEEPQKRDLSLWFTDEALEIEGGIKPHLFQPGQSSRSEIADYTPLRRKAAEFLIANQGKFFDEDELWAAIGDKDLSKAHMLTRVTTWVRNIEHEGDFVFRVFRPRKSNKTIYGVSDQFNVVLLPEAPVDRSEAEATRALGRAAVNPENTL